MAKILNLKEDICDMDNGSYLLLIEPQHIPHLVYLQDGRYYSLTYKGVELGFSFSPFLEKLIRLQKKMIFLEIERPTESAFQVFSDYVTAGEASQTCFFPIKQLLLPESKASLIYELIPELYANGQIKNASHFGLSAQLDENGDFEMSRYSKEDVLRHIANLKEKYAEG